MEDSGSESFTCDEDIKSEAPLQQQQQQQQQEPPLENHSVSSASNKQSSIFSLTLEEFQTKSGKSFGSMNMDEFLNSIWSEGNQDCPNLNQIESSNDPSGNGGSLAVPTPLCGKTVEEVWSEIHKNAQENIPNIIANRENLHQQTLGEMTLEDFLVKAGVIRESPTFLAQQEILENFQIHNTCLDMNVGTGQVMGYEFSTNHSNGGGNNNVIGSGSSMYQVYPQSGGFVGESPNENGNGKCNSPSDVSEPSSSKRARSGPTEAAIQRRQRRMIKNRESAARSRARKQAYTAELEIELNLLKEENAMLKFNLAEAENKRTHEKMMNEEQSTKMQRREEKSKTMRRTLSLSW